jgi:hypothetical protein
LLAAVGAVTIALFCAAWVVEIDTLAGDAAVTALAAVPFACCVWATWRLAVYSSRGVGGPSATLSFGVASLAYFVLGGVLSWGLLAAWQTALTIAILAVFGVAALGRRAWRRASA